MTGRDPDVRDELENAAWITVSEDGGGQAGRPGYDFTTTFPAQVSWDYAWLWATAHGIYEVFLNGQRVGNAELTPGFTSYRSTLQVQRYDISSLLRPGANRLTFRVSDGWFRGRCGAFRLRNNFGDQIGLLAAARAQYGREARTLAATGDDWQVTVGPIVSADLMDGQETDLRRIDSPAWRRAVAATDPLTLDRTRLVAEVAPPVRRVAEYPAVNVTRLPTGRQIVDFGTTVNGWVRLRSLGPASTTTTLTHGEWLDHYGDLTLDHLSFIEPDGTVHRVGQTDRVTSRGDIGDVFEPRHTTHGFRYVAIDGREDTISVDDITAVLVRSDLQPTGSFRTDNADLQHLHHVAEQSWRVNTCDVPTDCPQRERWGYTGDFQIFAHTAAFLDDIELFGRKWLRALADDQLPSGRINNVAPECGDTDKYDFDLNGSAGWGDAATIVPWELYETYGNTEVLAENFDMMRRWVDYVAEQARTGRHPARAEAFPEPRDHDQYLWDSGFHWGEWLEPAMIFDPFADQAIVATAYFSRSARIVADAAAVLGDTDLSSKFADISERAAHAWRTEFLRSDGTLTIETQATYTRALAFNLVPDELKPAAAARLVSLISAADGTIGTGFLSTPFLLPVLADNGLADEAFKLLFQRKVPGWMAMLDRGATAVWEAWEGVDEIGTPTDSLSHYSKGAVITFLHEYVAGLRRIAGHIGYRRFRIGPTMHEDIGSAAVDLQTTSGRIRVEWTRSGRTLTLTALVPDACEAELVLPGAPVRTLPSGLHTLVHELPA